MKSPNTSVLPGVTATLLCAILSACGGGSGDPASNSAEQAQAVNTSSSTTSADSASGTEVPMEATAAAQATVLTAQAVVATGDSGQPIACPGGGTAQYQLSGGNDDGAIAAGEVYTLSFDQCKGAAGAISVSGQASLSITAATPTEMGAAVAFNALSATLPRSTLSLNGGAQLSTGILYSRSGQVISSTMSTVFTADTVSVTRHAASRDTAYALTAVDIRQVTTSTANQVVSTALQGTATLTATFPNRQFSGTFEAQGAVTFVDGLPTNGAWQVFLPNTALNINAASGTVVVGIDAGRDGTVDRTLTFVVGDWSNTAQ
jgi:hypothetical protein